MYLNKKTSLSTKAKAHFGILAANIFFAINLSTVKYLTENSFIKPFAINILRVGISALLFWILLLFTSDKQYKIDKKDRGRFILCALCGIALNQSFFIKGLSLTYSIHAALLLLITPIIISLAAVIILKEGFSVLKIAGLLLGITGAAILISARHTTGSGRDIILGDILIILNAIVYAAYFILVKPLMLRYNPLNVMRWIFTIGLIGVFPLGFNELTEIQWTTFGFNEWVSISLVVIAGTFLAYLFNVYGIKTLGASVTGAYIYTQPIFASIIAMIFLGERLEMYKIVSAVFIFTGVFLSTKIFKKSA